MEIACPICNSNAHDDSSSGMHGAQLVCPRCGNFSIAETASSVWKCHTPTDRQIANASGWIREHSGVSIDSNSIESLLAIKQPSVAARAERLLLELERKSPALGWRWNINFQDAQQWLGVSYSANPEELYYLFLNYLVDEMGFVSSSRTAGLQLVHGQITPKGHAYLDGLKHTTFLSQMGFCAMWFDDTVRAVWTDAINPAIDDAGYEPKRIDAHQHNNKIDDEIVAMIRRSKFVVADFTGQRGGVYFEAGFALGLGLPVIWTCEKSDLDKVHFDNRQYNFVLWEKDKLSEFKLSLQNRIEATLGRGTFS